MKTVYFTVGPSQAFPTLEKHLKEAIKQDIPSLNHRGKEFKKLFHQTTANLKKLLDIPATHQIFFVSSALEAMERTIQSTVDEHSFHIVTGSFGKSWMTISSQLGKTTLMGTITDLKNLTIPKESELICITQNDTSTGIQIPMQEIYQLKQKYPKKLIALDVVSSIPYVDIDYSKTDVVFFSVQKGFGLPAGLGVLIVSPTALEKAKKVEQKKSIGSFHSFINLSQKATEDQTPETPNVLNIFLLNKVTQDMLTSGIKNIRQETKQKAIHMYQTLEKKGFLPAVAEKEYRSDTTLVFNTNGKTKQLKEKLLQKNLDIGSGYGEHKEDQMRLANFPTHDLKMVAKLLRAF